MIQDIFPKQYCNHYFPAEVQGDSVILLYQGKQILASTVEEITFPYYNELEEQLRKVTYLFSIDDTRYFLGETVEDFLPPEGYAFTDTVFLARNRQPRDRAFASITGQQLANWYRENRYCGTCATPLEHDGVERMLRCPHCGKMLFPQICPAVIVAVRNGDKLLMTKYAAGRGNPARYALIAGFTEIGETIEETVKREVWEETGLRIKNLQYYKSQPWSFSGSLLMGFFCEVDGDTEIHMDTEELSSAAWYPREEVPDDGGLDVSLTREMMRLFHRGEK